MATSKTFKVIGTSNLNGKVKIRFANDMTRVKVLVKSGHTDINLVELPEAMTKEAAIAYVKATNLIALPESTSEVSAEQVAAIAGE
jgi:hypothetical protein